jgi:hypothetical protein
MKKTEVPGEHPRSATNHWQTLPDNVVSAIFSNIYTYIIKWSKTHCVIARLEWQLSGNNLV